MKNSLSRLCQCSSSHSPSSVLLLQQHLKKWKMHFFNILEIPRCGLCSSSKVHKKSITGTTPLTLSSSFSSTDFHWHRDYFHSFSPAWLVHSPCSTPHLFLPLLPRISSDHIYLYLVCSFFFNSRISSRNMLRMSCMLTMQLTHSFCTELSCSTHDMSIYSGTSQKYKSTIRESHRLSSPSSFIPKLVLPASA